MFARPAVAALALVCLTPFAFAEDAKKPAETYQVPYRLADTKHIVIRARINGKGPFNLIVDTGAPALYLPKTVAQKAGVTTDKNGWATFDRVEVEGGVKLDKARGRVEDIFQLEGMNGLGAAGVELHGLIGYNILAQFRIEYDLTRDKMTWTKLDHQVAMPEKMGKGVPGSLEVMGSLMKFVGALMGRQANPELAPRGFLGIELADGARGVEIKSVLAKSAAAEAGLQAGDRVTHFQGKAVQKSGDVLPLAARIAAGEEARLKILRGDAVKEITIKTGKGL
jgi:hypothetical protein